MLKFELFFLIKLNLDTLSSSPCSTLFSLRFTFGQKLPIVSYSRLQLH